MKAFLLRSDLLVAGQYRGLVPLLGRRSRFNALQVLLLSLRPKATLSERHAQIWRKIENALGYRVTGLVLHAQDHAQTRWHGVATTDQQTYAIKFYHNHDDAYHEYTQTKLVEQYFMGPFVIPHVINCMDGVLISDLIQQKRGITADDAVLDRLFYQTEQAIERCVTFKTPLDIVPLNAPSLFTRLENSDLLRQMRAWLDQHPDPLPIIAIHGDMTPWNITVDARERLVLQSFERAGWHVPFYDVLHFILQPQCLLHKKTGSLATLLNDLPWDRYAWLHQAVVLYLIDQLCCDLADLYDHNYNDPWLLAMIKHKEAYLLESLAVT